MNTYEYTPWGWSESPTDAYGDLSSPGLQKWYKEIEEYRNTSMPATDRRGNIVDEEV